MSSSLVVEEGPSAADKRKLVRLIVEADARVASAEKNHLNSIDMLISAGQMYDEAKAFGRSIGITFPAALELAESPVGERMAKRCIMFANTPVVKNIDGSELSGPEQAVLAWRQKDAGDHAAYRKRIAGPDKELIKARANYAIRNLPRPKPEDNQTDGNDIVPIGEVAEYEANPQELIIKAKRAVEQMGNRVLLEFDAWYQNYVKACIGY